MFINLNPSVIKTNLKSPPHLAFISVDSPRVQIQSPLPKSNPVHASGFKVHESRIKWYKQILKTAKDLVKHGHRSLRPRDLDPIHVYTKPSKSIQKNVEIYNIRQPYTSIHSCIPIRMDSRKDITATRIASWKIRATNIKSVYISPPLSSYIPSLSSLSFGTGQLSIAQTT